MAPLGLILTFAPSLDALRRACVAMRAARIKCVPSWCPYNAAALRAMAPLLVRTSGGDPSSGRPYLDPARAVDEAAPFAAVDPELVIELGNEPNTHELDRARYVAEALATASALRRAYPRARLLSTALSPHGRDVGAWLAALRPLAEVCDGAAYHGYNEAEAAAGLGQLRGAGITRPAWLTEFNINQALAPAERARRIAACVGGLPVEEVILYHLDQYGGPALEQQGPAVYRLEAETLEALGAAPVSGWPDAEWVGMTRPRFTAGRGAWARPRAIVIHATGGVDSIGFLRRGGDAKPVSTHYLVSKDGKVRQLVRDADTAWHGGDGSITIDGRVTNDTNGPTIGIEIENLNDGKDTYPTVQIDATVRLTQYLTQRWDVPRPQLVRHLDIAPGRKDDPRPPFDWPGFVARVFPIDPWLEWGTAYPLAPQARLWSIPRAWRAESDAGRPLGRAVGPEQALSQGRAAQSFEKGVVVWLGGDRTEVVR